MNTGKFRNTSLLALLFLAVILPLQQVHAKTLRTAPIYIENRTGSTLDYVTVVHKYSDNYKEKKTFQNISNGRRTNDYLIARYHTGVLTTGVDWWYVAWKKRGDNRVYYTYPNNFRNIIDKIEQVAQSLTKSNKATEAIGNLLFNSESTVGFKRHMLTAEDENKPTIIVIRNNTVQFRSNSGNSSTEGIRYVMVSPDSPDSTLTCHGKLKEHVAWDYNGSKNWSQQNLNNLCGPADNLEPAHCFETVMHKGVSWGASTRWNWVNASNLCRKTLNASSTIGCFSKNVQSMGWKNAIAHCQS